MKLRSPCVRVPYPEALACNLLPDSSACAEFCDLFKETDRDIEEKSKSPQERFRIKFSADTILRIPNGATQRVGHCFGWLVERLYLNAGSIFDWAFSWDLTLVLLFPLAPCALIIRRAKGYDVVFFHDSA